MIRRFVLAALAAFCAYQGASQASAQERVTTRYVVSLIGLPVGRADFETQITPQSYSVSGSLASSGLANLVSRIEGTSSVNGRRGGEGLAAERYRLAYTSDDKFWRSDVRLRSGRVTSSDVAPDREENRPADFVPVLESQLAAVVDPLSGLMIQAPADEVCSRTLPLYDGWSRLDLQLSDGGRRDFRAEGFAGQAVVCNVRVVPVSGYRSGSKGLRYLQGQTLQLWFAPIGQTGIHAPVYARVPTQVGPLTLTAIAFAAR